VSEARIRLAGADDALVVAALTLQCALHRGAAAEPGFLDRFARAWSAQVAQRPAWVAEAGQEHAGYLLALAVRPLPWPGRGSGGGTLHVETFFVRPAHRGVGVGEQLLRAAVAWARAEGFERVAMTAGPHTRPMVERMGFAVSEGHREVVLG
jgi:GNAT superfamily N-acetyltransferase